ncbi:DUF222 domain-containing protein [Brachybacterium sp. AOP24-D1-21]|uniref:DUF222 domain-containing protein n=1 Tax=Brachybacterium sp. AOP24-D1-21 TaxID=3457711 RepID=UPI004034CB62
MTLVPLSPGGAEPAPLNRVAAESLGERIQQQAATIAAATCELLLMVGEFEARGAVGWFVGLKSTAHWLSWSCSMAPGTAREHVRVARALPSMPLTVKEFRAGRLSYSKVREMTRVADRVDEKLLVEMARGMTASQLSRTIAGVRAVDGIRLGQDAARQAAWFVREDGMIEIRAVLPAELGAEVLAALELAMDRDGSEPPAPESSAPTAPSPSDALRETESDPAGTDSASERAAEITTTATLEQRKADALHSLARTYLDAEPDDRSGEDRHLVIVQVSAEALAQSVPAGTPTASAPDTPVDEPPAPPAPPDDVPAGTPPRCGVLGAGPLEVATAERLACTGKVAVVITDAGGEVLHLGRSQRLASRVQRRALRLRDATCTFPGCHQVKHLDAHHLLPWSRGGPTDIEGLALLCRRHHVMVHEGGMRMLLDSARLSLHHRRFQVLDSTGRPVQARWPAMLEQLRFREEPVREDPVGADSGHLDTPASDGRRTAAATSPELDPGRIAATTAGDGFHLAACVDALCQSIIELAA